MQQKSEKLLSALLTVVLGVLLIIFKAAVLSWAVTVVGALLIVLAVFRILAKDLVTGIIEAVIGVAAIVLAWVIVDVLHIVLAVIILLYGLFGLYSDLKDGVKGKKILPLIFALLAPVLTIAAAILLFFSADWVYIVVGILVLVNGICNLVECLK